MEYSGIYPATRPEEEPERYSLIDRFRINLEEEIVAPADPYGSFMELRIETLL